MICALYDERARFKCFRTCADGTALIENAEGVFLAMTEVAPGVALFQKFSGAKCMAALMALAEGAR